MAEYSDRSFGLGSFLKQTVPNAAENFLDDPGENDFTLPSNRASKRVEVWRKLQRYGTVALGNSPASELSGELTDGLYQAME